MADAGDLYQALSLLPKVPPAIDAILSLRTKMAADTDAVDRIIVETSAETAQLDGKTFDSISAAQMSMPYGVAAALVFGKPTLEYFDDAARLDPRVLRLADRVDVRKSDDPNVSDRRLTARVSVRIAASPQLSP